MKHFKTLLTSTAISLTLVMGSLEAVAETPADMLVIANRIDGGPVITFDLSHRCFCG